MRIDGQNYRQNVPYLNEALKHDEIKGETLFYLGASQQNSGNVQNAIVRYQEALHFFSQRWRALTALSKLYSCHPDPIIRDPRKGLKLAKTACVATGFSLSPALEALALAYAANGRFDDAVQTSDRAIELAPQFPARELEEKLRERKRAFLRQNPVTEEFVDDYLLVQ